MMKNRKIKLMLFLALFGCETVSCTKEEMIKEQYSVAACQSATYVVDGQQYYANPQTDEEWAAFFDHMFALAEEGHTVQFWRNGQKPQFASTKEVETFKTKNREEALKWVKDKEDQGYTVTMTFNQQTREYTCIAIR